MVTRQQFAYLKALLADPNLPSGVWAIDAPAQGSRVVHIRTPGPSIVVGGYAEESLAVANVIVALHNLVEMGLLDIVGDHFEIADALGPYGGGPYAEA